MGYFDEQLEKAKAAGFAEPLARFIEIDRGHQRFNYPAAYGHLLATLDHIDDLLQAAMRGRRQGRNEYLKMAADYVAKTRQEQKEIDLSWDRHLERDRNRIDGVVGQAAS